MTTLLDSQSRFVDAIEVSVRMARVALDRMRVAIDQMRREPEASDSALEKTTNASVLLDAWSIVDIADRLAALIGACPGLRRTPRVRLALGYFAPAAVFRNHYQHLEAQTKESAGAGYPIWGSLGYVWATPEMAADGYVATAILLPGTFGVGSFPMVNPAGMSTRLPVDHVTLSLPQHSLNLSETVDHIEAFAAAFATALESARAVGANSRGFLLIELVS